jgi:hypothetical protein
VPSHSHSRKAGTPDCGLEESQCGYATSSPTIEPCWGSVCRRTLMPLYLGVVWVVQVSFGRAFGAEHRPAMQPTVAFHPPGKRVSRACMISSRVSRQNARSQALIRAIECVLIARLAWNRQLRSAGLLKPMMLANKPASICPRTPTPGLLIPSLQCLFY